MQLGYLGLSLFQHLGKEGLLLVELLLGIGLNLLQNTVRFDRNRMKLLGSSYLSLSRESRLGLSVHSDRRGRPTVRRCIRRCLLHIGEYA